MGGLRKKMPITAYTMLVGCLAIAGAGVPFVIGFSGYYSKDAIIAQALTFAELKSAAFWLFYVAAGGAAITAFYMFRMWYMTFAGKPRDHHVYDHAHESPKVMTVPLMILAVFAVVAGLEAALQRSLSANVLEQARPAGMGAATAARPHWVVPDEHPAIPRAIHIRATLDAFGHGRLGGFLRMAIVLYVARSTLPTRPSIRRCTRSCWTSGTSTSCTTSSFRPADARSWLGLVAAIDKHLIDGLYRHSRVRFRVDRRTGSTARSSTAFVDRLADGTYSLGRSRCNCRRAACGNT